jgi:hypothetical protein
LLETVEVLRAKAKGRGNEGADSSTVRNQQNGLASASGEEMVPKQTHAIIKAANRVLRFAMGRLHLKLARPGAPSQKLFGKSTRYFFKRQSFPLMKFDLPQPGIGLKCDFFVLRTNPLQDFLGAIRSAPQRT